VLEKMDELETEIWADAGAGSTYQRHQGWPKIADGGAMLPVLIQRARRDLQHGGCTAIRLHSAVFRRYFARAVAQTFWSISTRFAAQRQM